MKNRTLSEIAQDLMAAPPITNPQVSGYQIDSRQIAPGELFFALPGETTDGHLFLPQAKERGAAAAVVAKTYAGPSFGLPLIAVEDVLLSLQSLAQSELTRWPVPVIGITGSVGKTTTKEFAAQLLMGKYRVGKNIASYNTKSTMPLTILNRTGEEELLILEMGMSEPGDIGRLVSIAPPDIALVTKVGLAHAQFFPGGLAEIAAGKAEIFSHPQTKIAIFDHSFYDHWDKKGYGERRSFSLTSREADYFLHCEGNRWAIDEGGVRAHFFDLPFQEPHILHDLLGAIALARSCKRKWEEIEGQIGSLKLHKMRFEVVEKNGITWINDAYNANPESMKAALAALPAVRGKRIGVLGTMKELGSFSEEAHREVGRAATGKIDHLLVFGEEARPLQEGFGGMSECFIEIEPLIERLKTLVREGDLVLVKGSRSMKMERILD